MAAMTVAKMIPETSLCLVGHCRAACQTMLFRQRATEPRLAALVIERAALQLDLGLWRQCRPSGHDIDQPSRIVPAVQHRGRSLEHFHPLDIDQVGEDFRAHRQGVGEDAVDRVGRALEAAHDKALDAPAMGIAALDAAHVAQGVGHAAGPAGLPGPGVAPPESTVGYREARLGLGPDRAVRGLVAGQRADGRLLHAVLRGDGGGIQLQCRRRRTWAQDVGVAALRHGLQRGPAQQLFEALRNAPLALQAEALQITDHGGLDRQGDAGVRSEGGQDFAQGGRRRCRSAG